MYYGGIFRWSWRAPLRRPIMAAQWKHWVASFGWDFRLRLSFVTLWGTLLLNFRKLGWNFGNALPMLKIQGWSTMWQGTCGVRSFQDLLHPKFPKFDSELPSRCGITCTIYCTMTLILAVRIVHRSTLFNQETARVLWQWNKFAIRTKTTALRCAIKKLVGMDGHWKQD